MSCDNLIGPALPPAFGKNSDEDSDHEQGFAGPALPPDFRRRTRSSSSDESDDDDDDEVVVKKAKTSHQNRDGFEAETSKDEDDGFFGPALPPGFKKQHSSPERPPVLGPALPPGFHRTADDDDDDDDDGEDDSEGFSGPALPPDYKAEPSSSEEDENDDVIGPMPAKETVQDSVAVDIERRAQRMKQKLSGDDAPEVLGRETWMTELPPELQHIGLGARTFKKRSGPENKDRSMWTDTPADKERKARERLEGKKDELEKDDVPKMSHKDVEMAEKVYKYNEKKRGESLISLHAKKMKKEADKEAGQPVERRPFDRDNDLQVNRFDEVQKQRLLKKSQELNTRFSHSKDRMFL